MSLETNGGQGLQLPGGGKIFNVLSDWYLTTCDGVTHGPYSTSKEALDVRQLLANARRKQAGQAVSRS